MSIDSQQGAGDSQQGAGSNINQLTSDPAKLGHVLYALFALGFITGGLTTIAGFILALLVQDQHRSTWLASHITWLLRTAIIGFAAGVLALVLMVVLIGLPIMIMVGVWVIYRIVKGWLAVSQHQPLPAPSALF